MDIGSPMGTIEVLPRIGVPVLGSTTHSLSPRLLADAMAQGISGEVTFLGIQPGHVRLGHPVSVEVGLAVKTVSSVLLEFFLPRAKPYKATKSPSGGGDFVAC